MSSTGREPSNAPEKPVVPEKETYTPIAAEKPRESYDLSSFIPNTTKPTQLTQVASHSNTDSRISDDLALVSVIPQTGFANAELIGWYGANSPFADMGINDEAYFETLSLYTQGVITPVSGVINPRGDLTPAFMIETLGKISKNVQIPQMSQNVTYLQAQAAINASVGKNLKQLARNDEFTKNIPDDKVLSRAEFFTLLYKSVSVHDTQTTSYSENLEISIPGLGIENVSAERVLMSHPSGWLRQLQDGAGYYQDTRPGHGGRYIVFAHSSRYEWMTDTEIPFTPLVGADAVGQKVRMKVNGRTKSFLIQKATFVDESEVNILRNVPSNVKLTLFTCDLPDVTNRWVYDAVEVFEPFAAFNDFGQSLKASLFDFGKMMKASLIDFSDALKASLFDVLDNLE